jgi:mRNA interferase MazF
MQRGEVWWASLSSPKGSRPGCLRPVLVIQAAEFNASKIGTVVVVEITSNVALAAAPGNVSLPKRETGLPKRSVANVSQLLTLDKSVLTERCGRIGRNALKDLEEGIRLVLSL